MWKQRFLLNSFNECKSDMFCFRHVVSKNANELHLYANIDSYMLVNKTGLKSIIYEIIFRVTCKMIAIFELQYLHNHSSFCHYFCFKYILWP